MLELRFVDAENRDFHDLTAALDEYYFMLVGDVEKRYAKYNLPHLFNCRIVAYEDGKPAGCGAWKKIDEGTFEVKRIYIAPEFRRKGVASAVIAALEQDAAKHGFTKAILRPPARPRIRRRCTPSSAIASFRTTAVRRARKTACL
ncbi:MAG: GNAT family N-acetyltransferase [Butyricicoccus sp.]